MHSERSPNHSLCQPANLRFVALEIKFSLLLRPLPKFDHDHQHQPTKKSLNWVTVTRKSLFFRLGCAVFFSGAFEIEERIFVLLVLMCSGFSLLRKNRFFIPFHPIISVETFKMYVKDFHYLTQTLF
jgi:hypothetical protein